jgi:hypothetical protein
MLRVISGERRDLLEKIAMIGHGIMVHHAR